MKRSVGALVLGLLGIAAACDEPGRADSGTEKRPAEPGMELDARGDDGESLHFRIEAVEKDAADLDGDVSFYTLSVRHADGVFRPYCAADFEGKSRAIPVKGSWDERATYVPGSEEKTTFACTSGAIGKCIRFGYKPWQTRDGKSMLAHHQACVRMVRADYCGDGRPHTKDGTKIDIWDRAGIQKRDPLTAEHPEVFEAAWGPDGAVFLATPRWSDDVASVVAECPHKLAGRSSADRALALGEVERDPDALLFNGRFVNEPDRWYR